ncbi:sensor histidine kinase [Azospirillum rugosum]|uniref:histidine kinase n=1 Tax=Azospirillum rugosum TaxID=416170 RepID=A0ABS4SM62_9PROT|nr:ATP-binding protein [Azospirillum rugosum]MBP2293653.1 signal transduction histidine kinase [Azospirillum rugosum]MDQ0527198.1 signal transduction histidine kinase [Azospirillum rugosum]
MRIRYRIALVGGVPVAVAAVIAVSGWLLLSRSEKVYEAAVLAGSVYRDVTAATAARVDYLQVAPDERGPRAERFRSFAESARSELASLGAAMRGTQHEPALTAAAAVLDRSISLINIFVGVTRENDALVADMARHAATLIGLTDRARARQHASNVDLLGSLTEADQRLRDSREIVDRAHELREAMLSVARSEAEQVAGLVATAAQPTRSRDVRREVDRLITSARHIQQALLRTDTPSGHGEAVELAQRYAAAVDGLQRAVAAVRDARARQTAEVARFEREADALATLNDGAEATRVGLLVPVVRALALSGLLDRQPGVAALVAETPPLLPAFARLLDGQAEIGRANAALEAAQRASAEAASAIEALTARILTLRTTGYTAIQDEVVQLLAFSIQANDTEQETQNVAVVSLRLGRQAADAVARRDAEAADAVVGDAERLLAVVRGLPMSPLLQDEVVAAIEKWRDSLGKTAMGLRRLNATLVAMDDDSAMMVETARQLDETFREQAASIGALLTRVLLVGATIGLLLGGGTALVVARSISRPVLRLKEQMVRLAADPQAANPLAGRIDGTGRQDEFGEMARAAAFFLGEIGRREGALRHAKDQADRALLELRQTQADLIQAEKMASLGQLVAGVAHEINTPLGNALMGASHLSDRLAQLSHAAAGGTLRKKGFDQFMAGAEELTRLMLINLDRATRLVQSFKSVAADQTSGDRRRFDLRAYLDELVTSLNPSWRRAGHAVRIDCPDSIDIDGHPGILAQILTNFVMNSVVHGFDDGRAGLLSIKAGLIDEDTVELVYTDTGKGIDPAHLGRIFDPFFTTKRSKGSTGLGLHIVYNLVTSKLGGRIAVESAPGQGVCFTIRFPRRVTTVSLP